jgi:molybdopterin-guanine dinucleotide biosynthesis protein A
MSTAPGEPIGVILAGGMGRRLGGAKAFTELDGRPLISYPLAAMQAALREVVVVAKADSALPSLPGVDVWLEPPAPRHPLIGIVHALRRAAGRPVLVCATDLPLITAELVACLAEAEPEGAPAVLAAAQGRAQPLLGCYQPAALGLLPAPGALPLRELIAAIGPRLLEVGDPDLLFNVNSPQDVLRGASILASRR